MKIVDILAKDKILITGGTGFLGRALVEKLVSCGISLAVLTRDSKNSMLSDIRDKINVFEVDLLDFPRVKSFVEDFRPGMIVHLAGYVHPPQNNLDFLDKFNYEATARLLDLADVEKVKKFILIGTADEYGFQNCPHKETTPAMPVSEYAVSKNKAVNYALSLFVKKKMPVVVLRPFTIYGVGQPASMFISQAVECAVKEQPFEMSKGEQKRDLLFITDFVNAIIKTLVTNNIEGEIFNVGSGKAIALKDLAEKIWEVAGADKSLLKIGARSTNENELHDTQADISKISAVLNWKPEISLKEGLKTVVEAAKRHWNGK